MSIDPIEELRAIEERAKKAIDSLAEGRATTGASALVAIHDRARDALRHVGAASLTGQSEQHSGRA